VRPAYPRLGDLDHVVRQTRRDPLEHRPVHLQRPQIPGVDADHLGTGVQGPVGLFLVVHLDERGHAQRLDPLQQPDQHVLLERGHNEQHQVGTVRPCLMHLVRRDDEVLAQHRHTDRGSHGRQILQRPAEPPALGEHADAARAAGRVLTGQFRRVRNVGQRALRRRRPLDLGDDGHARLAQGRVRVDRRWGRRGEVPHLLQRDPLLAGRYVLADPGQDLFEHVRRARTLLRGAATARSGLIGCHVMTPLSGCLPPDARWPGTSAKPRGMACLTSWAPA
jgi:hypothetical protein